MVRKPKAKAKRAPRKDQYRMVHLALSPKAAQRLTWALQTVMDEWEDEDGVLAAIVQDIRRHNDRS